MSTIFVNGDPLELAVAPITVADVLDAIGVDLKAPGIAIAVDSEILPRFHWTLTELAEGARVEIVGATQGG